MGDSKGGTTRRGSDGEEGDGLEMVQRAGALRGQGCRRRALLGRVAPFIWQFGGGGGGLDDVFGGSGGGGPAECGATVGAV